MELKPQPPTQPLGAKARTDLRLSRLDDAGRLPWRGSAAPVRPTAAIVATASRVTHLGGAFVLGGGDPLADQTSCLELISSLTALRPQHFALATPGYTVDASSITALLAAGVRRLIVPFHAARQDAHDWLVATPGGLKATTRAIRIATDGDLPVTAEIVITRPTLRLLPETVEVLTRLGVRSICVRRLREMDVDPTTFVPMSPRIATLEGILGHAAEVALRGRTRLILRDFPLCAAPRLRPLFANPDSELWIATDGSATVAAREQVGCPGCPGLPHCGGAPSDYTRRFGWEEFAPPADTPVRADAGAEISAPLVFSWHGVAPPACSACTDGDATATSTRALRAALVQAARAQPPVLRLVGFTLLSHPDAASLLYDAVRLFPTVEVAGPAGHLADWSDLDLRRLKDIRRIDFALFGPDAASHDAHCGISGAFAAMQRGVERLREFSTIEVGSYAVIHDEARIHEFARAWRDGTLPGVPRFRLSSDGGSLDALAVVARELDRGAARDALNAVLPRCLLSGPDAAVASPRVGSQFQVRAGRLVPHTPAGVDPLGSFDACDVEGVGCGVPECVGTAVGWQRTARTKTWVASM